VNAHRSRLGVKAYLGAIGQVLAEILYPLVICAVGAGLLFAVNVHPYVTLSALIMLVAGTVFLFGRRSARAGDPWPRPKYLFAAMLIAAGAGIAVVVAIGLRGICGCL
jgi:hypothetical protein